MPELGEFNFLGAYQIPSVTITDTGGRTLAYTTELTAWGKLRRINGSRNTTTEVEVSSAWTWECHFQSGLSIDIKNRWVIDGKTFSIVDFDLIDQKRQFYKFKLAAVE